MTIRPRIQRAFLAWLASAEPRLMRKIQIRRRADRILYFHFDVGGLALQGWLERGGISIGAFNGNQWYDLIYDDIVAPQRVVGDYICRFCSPSEQCLYATREDVWIAHLFEPFLTWVNETLAPAQSLALFETEPIHGATWAKLTQTPDQNRQACVVIPLNPTILS